MVKKNIRKTILFTLKVLILNPEPLFLFYRIPNPEPRIPVDPTRTPIGDTCIGQVCLESWDRSRHRRAPDIRLAFVLSRLKSRVPVEASLKACPYARSGQAARYTPIRSKSGQAFDHEPVGSLRASRKVHSKALR